MKSLPGKKVLVVDSSSFIHNALRTSLQSLGATVETDTGSDSALKKIINWHPDLLVTGVEIGTINGYDLCLILKLMPDYAGIPVIIISSTEKDVALRRAADAGADYYVEKNATMVASVRELAVRILLPGVRTTRETTPNKRIGSVLVVDDSRVMRRLIVNILRMAEVENIQEAGNGVEALEKLGNFTPDLVLTDWNMPRMNGLELVQTMKKSPEYCGIPVAMVTTESGKNEVAEAKAAGADAHLRKPFSVQSMKEMLQAFSDRTNG